MKNGRSHLTALSLNICCLWNTKEPTPLFEKSRGHPGGVANLSLAGWVIRKDTLKMEPRFVVCPNDYKQINVKY